MDLWDDLAQLEVENATELNIQDGTFLVSV